MKTDKTNKVNKTKENKKIGQAPAKVKKALKITKEMNLGEVVFRFPKTEEVLLDFGLHCVGCFANSFDTIEMGAKVHGMSDEEINEMVGRLNEVIAFEE